MNSKFTIEIVLLRGFLKKSAPIHQCTSTHHFVVDLVEVDLADLVDSVLDLEGDESEPSVAIGLLVEHKHRVFDLQQIRGQYYRIKGKEEICYKINLIRRGGFG